jgi:hypothetical protein
LMAPKVMGTLTRKSKSKKFTTPKVEALVKLATSQSVDCS